MVVRHPSIWIFIRHLKDAQATLEVSGDAADNGAAAPPRKRKWKRLEERIERLKEQYETGHRTLRQYWKAVSNSIINYQ